MNFKISNMKEENDVLKFTLDGLDVCYANSVRRIIISEIPLVVFKTMPYEENKSIIYDNTTKLNNEILKQRLSCIPIHISDLSIPFQNYLLELDEENTSDMIQIVTTKDFKIKNKETNTYLSEKEVRVIFPPFIGLGSSDEYYIDFVKLNPKISDAIPGAKIKLSCEFSISNATDDSMFNVVSVCSYGNTLDEKKIDETLTMMTAKWKEDGKSKEDIQFETKNWKTLEAKRLFKPNSFDFTIQTLGIYENKEMVKKACMILSDKLVSLLDSILNNDIVIEQGNTTIPNCYDIKIKDEYFEVGNILNHLLFVDYYSSDLQVLSYVGFKKMHPHDDESVLRIAFETDHNGLSAIQDMLNKSIQLGIKTFEKMSKMF